MSKIASIAIYPFKGLRGEMRETVEIVPGIGIPGDRAFGFIHAELLPPGEDPRMLKWCRKQGFAMQNDWPILAGVDVSFDSTSGLVRFQRDGISHSFDTRRDEGRQSIEAYIEEYLAKAGPAPKAYHPEKGKLILVGNGDGSTRFPDRGGADLSILNLASLRELSAEVGQKLDAGRFRANIIIDGLKPWAEMAMAGETLVLGSAKALIKAPIGRCHNINVDPKSGDDRLQVLATLENKFGHSKFGVIAQVIEGGSVSVGDFFGTKS